MLFEGIVTQVDIANNKVKVRVPEIHGVTKGTAHVSNGAIEWANIATIPGMKYTPQVNDVVAVGFYNFDISKPVVLGAINAKNIGNRDVVSDYSSLNVRVDAQLPEKTTIGEVSADSLQYLKGLKESLPTKLDNLDKEIADNKGFIGSLEKSVSKEFKSVYDCIDQISTNIETVLSNVMELAKMDSKMTLVQSNFTKFFNEFIKDYYSCSGKYQGMSLLCDGSFARTIPTDPMLYYFSNDIISDVAQRVSDTCTLWYTNGATSSSTKTAHDVVREITGEQSSWCAATVKAIIATAYGKIDYQSAKSFNYPYCADHLVSAVMWGSSSKYSNTPPNQVCKSIKSGRIREIFIPKKELLKGGSFNNNGVPDIRPGDIGINKGWYDGKQASHAYLITGYSYDSSTGEIKITKYGGNEGSESLVRSSVSINTSGAYSQKFSGIIRPNYDEQNESVPNKDSIKTFQEVYQSMFGR